LHTQGEIAAHNPATSTGTAAMLCGLVRIPGVSDIVEEYCDETSGPDVGPECRPMVCIGTPEAEYVRSDMTSPFTFIG
jgi:hypothetical protein